MQASLRNFALPLPCHKAMKLTVIIINYNVEHFLEQCLQSVRLASQNIDTETIVVDNNSVDGSLSMLREKFPEVKIMANHENLGFSKANNQAIRVAKGEYVLLLNPDTVVEAGTFALTLAFMDEHPEAGALGVKMIDGKGHFLPESKRSLPTPAVSFFKISGLASLFPRSRTFGKYHLGYLDKDKIHQVEVLSGAFMLLRKSALDKTGLLDEAFFMYGEDIDLSYRITRAGYVNYYFPLTRIIHYKGESTKKSSVNYVFTFYNAMIVFARKHFSDKNARTVSVLIHLAIYLRAFAAILSRFFSKVILPLTDALMMYAGLFFISRLWENYIFPWGGHYPGAFVYLVLPIYILFWLFCIYLVSGYDKPLRIIRIVQGLSLGTLVILVLYSLLDESLRYSRAIILFGFLWGLLSLAFIRIFIHKVLHIKTLHIANELNKRFIIIGNALEAERVAALVRNAFLNPGFIGLVSLENKADKNSGFIGNISQLREIIEIYGIDDVIFCSKNMPAGEIIDKMSELQDLQVEFRTAPQESMSIIGSKSISTAEEIYINEIDSIGKINNRRHKFFLDIFTALVLMISLPVNLFIMKQPLGYIRNIFRVLLGKRTWVGYCPTTSVSVHKLPVIRKGILNPVDVFRNKNLDDETITKLNLLYARDYKIMNDLNIIFKAYRDLGRK
jgi:O-antigen biosynthesis protein